MSARLTPTDLDQAARRLDLEPCALRAVVAVESSGSGFLPDGRVKILFEGHCFWKELRKRGIDPLPLAAEHPGILHPRWDKSRYLGGAGEHVRLAEAILIHREAALCSASYGLFQIMGFNFPACGFADVESMLAAHARGERDQLEAFCRFLDSENLIPLLRARDWSGFARRYNGPGYAANRYDYRLAQAYERCLGDRA